MESMLMLMNFVTCLSGLFHHIHRETKHYSIFKEDGCILNGLPLSKAHTKLVHISQKSCIHISKKMRSRKLNWVAWF